MDSRLDRFPGVFVIGTDTGVGKTHQACRLSRMLADRGCRVGVYKPALTGYTLQAASRDGTSDAELLQAAARSTLPLARICPQSFAVPAAPPVAASLEGRTVDESLLLAGALWWREQCDFLVVEGVGGALSPISENLTVLDIASQLRLPAVVVAANRLGVVSHVLLVIEALVARHLPIKGVVLNELPDAEHQRAVESEARSTNLQFIQQFLQTSKYASLAIPVVDSIERLF